MRKIFYTLGILIITSFEMNWGQEVNNYDAITSLLSEHIQVFTDRSIYCSGEEIYFGASYATSPKLNELSWSTVVYIELMNSNGNSVIREKFPLDSFGVSGRLKLPENMSSGMYYLKAYTKWMRNYSTSHYGFCQIKVINPQIENVYSAATFEKTNSKRQKNELVNDTTIKIATNKPVYGKVEKVQFSIELNDRYSGEDTYFISVVKKGLENLIYPVISDKAISEADKERDILYYPEINGISLSGRVLDISNDQPVKDAKVDLTCMGNQAFLTSFLTDENGQFFLYVPENYPDQDFFISAVKENLKLKIILDDEFCERPVYINQSEFKLSDEEKILAEEISINHQLIASYKEEEVVDSSRRIPEKRISFYGQPEIVYDIDKYIEMPSIEEFIYELMPQIMVSREKGERTLKLLTPNALSYAPILTLVDNIPVYDLDRFLEIPTNKIERIELIEHGYVIGNLRFGGIFNAISKNGDMAGIDLSENSFFFNYQMISSKEEDGSVISNHSDKDKIPDLRNCLYWSFGKLMDLQAEKSFSFIPSDNKGEYIIILRIISGNTGHISHASKVITVE